MKLLSILCLILLVNCASQIQVSYERQTSIPYIVGTWKSSTDADSTTITFDVIHKFYGVCDSISANYYFSGTWVLEDSNRIIITSDSDSYAAPFLKNPYYQIVSDTLNDTLILLYNGFNKSFEKAHKPK
jgi:hypothetical protein